MGFGVNCDTGYRLAFSFFFFLFSETFSLLLPFFKLHDIGMT